MIKQKYSYKIVFAHFQTIKRDRPEFILWLLTSVVLSLTSFWLPLILGFLIDVNKYEEIMKSNPFIIFSIVFLSNSIYYSINQIGAGKNKFSMSIRNISLVIVIILIIILSSIVPLKIFFDKSLNDLTQYVLLAFVLLFGIYIYGFRKTEWEDSIEEHVIVENEEVKELSIRAHQTNKDEGIKL